MWVSKCRGSRHVEPGEPTGHCCDVGKQPMIIPPAWPQFLGCVGTPCHRHTNSPATPGCFPSANAFSALDSLWHSRRRATPRDQWPRHPQWRDGPAFRDRAVGVEIDKQQLARVGLIDRSAQRQDSFNSSVVRFRTGAPSPDADLRRSGSRQLQSHFSLWKSLTRASEAAFQSPPALNPKLRRIGSTGGRI